MLRMRLHLGSRSKTLIMQSFPMRIMTMQTDEQFFAEGAKTAMQKNGVFHKYIGVKKGLLAKYRSRIVYADGAYELFPGAYLLAHSTPGLGELGEKAGLYVRCGCRLQPDDFSHEQSLVLDTPKGLVIFNSCSHGGADNIIAETADAFPQKHSYALIGGLHLFDSPEAEVRALAERIRSTGIERVITGHCTGKRAYAILYEKLGGVGGADVCRHGDFGVGGTYEIKKYTDRCGKYRAVESFLQGAVRTFGDHGIRG